MKNRLPLILIILIGVLTPVLSTLMFYFAPPGGQVNSGIVLPAATVDASSWQTATDDEAFSLQQWRGDWVLLSAAPAACDEACRRRLCQMRQLRLMLPGYYLRVRRAWLITDDNEPPPQIMQRTGCGEVADELAAGEEDMLDGVELLYAPADSLPLEESYLYLIDPAGIWTMAFAAELTTYQVRSDVRRLLKIAKGRKQLPKN